MAVLRKVGIIGIGHVGAHVANAVLSAGLAEELKLCDVNEQKVVSECQDLSDTLGFYPHNCVIGNYGTQYEQLADCDVVINAAGDVKTSAKDRDGELQPPRHALRKPCSATNTMRPPAPRCLPANKAKAAITPACRASSARTALKKSSIPHSPKANRPNSTHPASISAPISRSLHGGTTNAIPHCVAESVIKSAAESAVNQQI